MTSAAEIVRACFVAYEDKDRRAIEEILSNDFTFTSPLDNKIDRQTYLGRCWPISKNVQDFKLVNLVESGSQVFVTYVSTLNTGKSFRNTEIFEVVGGKIKSVEVYFGWDVPHKAAMGSFLESDNAKKPNRHLPDPVYGDGTEA
ncbi:MAG TPA: nuclear transport factor 2 family protein [Aestuariivirga sp.]|nr:nuclear transport factor 2 family protein [Aestuariivirga sp.]